MSPIFSVETHICIDGNVTILTESIIVCSWLPRMEMVATEKIGQLFLVPHVYQLQKPPKTDCTFFSAEKFHSLLPVLSQ